MNLERSVGSRCYVDEALDMQSKMKVEQERVTILITLFHPNRQKRLNKVAKVGFVGGREDRSIRVC